MHVHANYSQQLASLGASRNEVQEIAERRSAEVRRRLAAASGALHATEDDLEAGAGAVQRYPADSKREDADSAEEENPFGRYFSEHA